MKRLKGLSVLFAVFLVVVSIFSAAYAEPVEEEFEEAVPETAEIEENGLISPIFSDSTDIGESGLVPDVYVINDEENELPAVSLKEILAEEINTALANESDSQEEKTVDEELEEAAGPLENMENEEAEEYTASSEETVFDPSDIFEEAVQRRYDLEGTGNYIVYSDTALLVPAEITETLIFADIDTITSVISGIPEELANVDFTRYSSIVFITGNAEEHIIYVPSLVDVSGDGTSLTIYSKDTGAIGHFDIYQNVKYQVQSQASLNPYSLKYIFDDSNVNGSLEITGDAYFKFDFDWFDSTIDLQLEFNDDFDLAMLQATTSKDFDIDSVPEISDYITYDVGMFTLPADLVDIGIDFSFRTCCTGPIYMKGSSQNEFRFGTGSGLDSVTEYERIQPINPGKTYAYIGLGFGAVVLIGVTGGQVGIAFSGIGGDRIAVDGNDTVFESAVSRDGKIVDHGIIHYCAAGENGFCISGDHGAIRSASLKFVIVMFGDTQTVIDWDMGVWKDSASGFYYSERYTAGLEEKQECKHKAYQVEARVYDEDGQPMSGVEITSSDIDQLTDEVEKAYASGITQENGSAVLYRTSGTYGFEAGPPIKRWLNDTIKSAPMVIYFNNTSPVIKSVKVEMPFPKAQADVLAQKSDMELICAPDDPVIDRDAFVAFNVEWKERDGKQIFLSVPGQQFFTFTMEAGGNRSFSENCAVDLNNNDSDEDANQNYRILTVSHSADNKRITVTGEVSVPEPHTEMYHVKINDGLWGEGDYEPGKPVMIAARHSKEQAAYFKTIMPDQFQHQYEIVEELIQSSWTDNFEKWRVDSEIAPTIIHPIGDSDRDAFTAVAFFIMPHGDVEITALYKDIDDPEVPTTSGNSKKPDVNGKNVPATGDTNSNGMYELMGLLALLIASGAALPLIKRRKEK